MPENRKILPNINKKEKVSAIYYDKKIATIPQGNIDLRFDTILKDLALLILQVTIHLMMR
jgi:hypothetical protein